MTAERPKAGAVPGCNGKFGGDEHLAAERLVQRFNPGGLVYSRSDYREIEAVGRADIAVQHFPDVKREVDLGVRLDASALWRLRRSSLRIASLAASIAS